MVAKRSVKLPRASRRSPAVITCLSLLLLILVVLFLLWWPRFRPPGAPREEKMSLNTLDATVSDFEQVFERFKSAGTDGGTPHKKFLLFLADRDPATNLTWCPDCNRAEPVIYEKLEASTEDVTLLRAYVGDKPTWRNPNHPWRMDPRFTLQGVPTLIRWENDSIVGRLEDYEADDEHKVGALLASN